MSPVILKNANVNHIGLIKLVRPLHNTNNVLNALFILFYLPSELVFVGQCRSLERKREYCHRTLRSMIVSQSGRSTDVFRILEFVLLASNLKGAFIDDNLFTLGASKCNCTPAL